MKHKDLRPWLSVIAGGESLVSHAGGALLVETARRSGLSAQLSRLLGPWRLPLAVHGIAKNRFIESPPVGPPALWWGGPGAASDPTGPALISGPTPPRTGPARAVG